MKFVSVVLIWLFVASAAEASPAPRLGGFASECDAQTATTLRKLLRYPKSYGGPIAKSQPLARLGLRFDLSPHVRRAKRATNNYDPAAIQNDAPAARVAVDAGPLPSLCQLGFLIGPVDSRPRTRAFSPRSPRGPPASV